MIEIAVKTCYGIDKYAFAPFLCSVHKYNCREVLFKVPQPFVVSWHILMRKGAYKERKISVSKRKLAIMV